MMNESHDVRFATSALSLHHNRFARCRCRYRFESAAKLRGRVGYVEEFDSRVPLGPTGILAVR